MAGRSDTLRVLGNGGLSGYGLAALNRNLSKILLLLLFLAASDWRRGVIKLLKVLFCSSKTSANFEIKQKWFKKRKRALSRIINQFCCPMLRHVFRAGGDLSELWTFEALHFQV